MVLKFHRRDQCLVEKRRIINNKRSPAFGSVLLKFKVKWRVRSSPGGKNRKPSTANSFLPRQVVRYSRLKGKHLQEALVGNVSVSLMGSSMLEVKDVHNFWTKGKISSQLNKQAKAALKFCSVKQLIRKGELCLWIRTNKTFTTKNPTTVVKHGARAISFAMETWSRWIKSTGRKSCETLRILMEGCGQKLGSGR